MTNPAIFDVIQKPLITEKSTVISEFGKVVFQVAPTATKADVKQAVEELFKVKVTKVNIINAKGKVKRFRGKVGKRNDTKKAIVTLESGQSVDVMAGIK